jgi:uncharacterized protein
MMAEAPRFLPGRHLIESFGNGGFRLGGVSHHGALLITPSGARAIAADDVSAVAPEQLSHLIAEKSGIDMLLIGTGREMLPLPQTLSTFLQRSSLAFDVMNTNAAVRTYNVVLAEDRRVAAILIAVDKAYG